MAITIHIVHMCVSVGLLLRSFLSELKAISSPIRDAQTLAFRKLRMRTLLESTLSHRALAYQQILGELLRLDAAPGAGLHAEARIQQPGQHLDGVELAVSVQRKPYHLPAVKLVPGGTGPRVQDRLVRLGKHLVQDGPLGRDQYALAQVGRDVQRHHVVAGRVRLYRALTFAPTAPAERWNTIPAALPLLLQQFDLFDHSCKREWKSKCQ